MKALRAAPPGWAGLQAIFCGLGLAAACMSGRGEQAGGEPATILGQDAAAWLRYLEGHEIPEERRLAVYCLGEFGAAAGHAVPALTKLIHYTLDAELPRLAMESLGRIGPAARPALGELLNVLGDDRSPAALRRAACEAVARIAPEAPEVEKAVLKAMRESHAGLRTAAIDGALTVALCGRSDQAVSALGRAVREGRDAEAAAAALRCLGPAGVPPLAEALARASDAQARRVAAEALRKMGRLALSASPALLRAAEKDREASVRAACLSALAALTPSDATFLELCAQALAEKELRPVAQEALRRAGPDALSPLREALRSDSPQARAEAARALGALGRAAAPAQDDLLRASRDRESSVRLAAVEALNQLGPAAAGACVALELLSRTAADPALKRAARLAALNVSRAPDAPPLRSPLELLPTGDVLGLLAQDESPAVRVEAAVVLRSRTGEAPAAVAGLAAALDDADLQVRAAAAKSLAFFGAAAKPAAAKLIGWLRAPEPLLRQGALAALTAIGPAAPEALGPIVSLALSPAGNADGETASLLGYALRAHAPASVEQLAQSLTDRDLAVAVRAAQGLRRIGELAGGACGALLKAALSSDEELVRAALEALAGLGPAARETVPTILEFLTYDLPAWRRAAAEALGEIGFDPVEGDKHRMVEALLPVLLDADEDVAWAAFLSLYLIGEPVLPKVRAVLKIVEGSPSLAILRVMAKLKADPQQTIPRLVEFTAPGMRPNEKAVAAELLGLYAPERAEAVPALIRLLGDPTDYVARAASRSLGAFGPAGAPALEAAIRGRDPAIRRGALAVLEELDQHQQAGPQPRY